MEHIDTENKSEDYSDQLSTLTQRRDYLYLSSVNQLSKHSIVSALKQAFIRNAETPYLLHIDFSKFSKEKLLDAELFSKELNNQIIDFSHAYNLETPTEFNSILKTFKFILNQTRNNSVVLLVEEYDYSLTNALKEQKFCEELNKILLNFFKCLKLHSIKFRFVFITGCTSFKDSPIFDAVNNVRDVSEDPKFKDIVDY